MRSRSPANSADSSPPSPDLISRIASLASVASRGTSSWRSRSSAASRRSASSAASSANDGVLGAELAGGLEVVAERAASPGRRGRPTLSSAYRWLSRLASAWSACSPGRRAARSSSACSATQPVDRLEHPRPPRRSTVPRRHSRTPVHRDGWDRRPRGRLLASAWPLSGLPWRSGPRSGPRGHRCRGSSACRCRTGGRPSRRRRGCVPLRRGAARGERVAAGAGHLGLDVRRVDVLLHDVLSLSAAGSSRSDASGREPEPRIQSAKQQPPSAN